MNSANVYILTHGRILVLLKIRQLIGERGRLLDVGCGNVEKLVG